MGTQAHPGKGLSVSQLAFALNEELKRAVHSPSFTLDKVSQLDRDVSAALATIREWKNSFVPINRVPLEILSLIPTHLSLKDRFQATFVCRHWRRTFIQHATLWTELRLRKGEAYAKTLLERARGSPLDIFAGSVDPVGAVALLPFHTKQIKYLDIVYIHFMRQGNTWNLSKYDCGPLPLLRTLRITVFEIMSLDNPETTIPPSLPLFSSAVNLQEFWLRSQSSPPLHHFVFPTLTSFDLSVAPMEGFRDVSQLLDFLEALPVLRTVHLKIIGDISLDGVPQERVVVLPKVESLCLVMSDGEWGYKLATHMSCPSAKYMSLTHEKDTGDVTPEEIFPASVSWNAIVRQYTRSPVEEVSLEIETALDFTKASSLTFRSPDATVISLRFEVAENDEDEDEDEGEPEILAEIYHEVFSQASRTIRDLTLVANVNRLRMCHCFRDIGYLNIARIAYQVGQLFTSVGSLEELTLHRCDVRPYLAPFLDNPALCDVKQLVAFPPIKELTISYPLCVSRGDFAAAIAGLVESQHALGVPFERVTVRMDNLPAEMTERLRPWVGTVHCYSEPYRGD